MEKREISTPDSTAHDAQTLADHDFEASDECVTCGQGPDAHPQDGASPRLSPGSEATDDDLRREQAWLHERGFGDSYINGFGSGWLQALKVARRSVSVPMLTEEQRVDESGEGTALCGCESLDGQVFLCRDHRRMLVGWVPALSPAIPSREETPHG